MPWPTPPAAARARAGAKKASLQGMAGLALQNRLPNARILYVSATGATTPENLAYAARLGLWGGPRSALPHPRRLHGRRGDGRRGGDGADRARAEGHGPLHRPLAVVRRASNTRRCVIRSRTDDIAIWDAWADAYQLIHQNLRAALEAVGDHRGRQGQERPGRLGGDVGVRGRQAALLRPPAGRPEVPHPRRLDPAGPRRGPLRRRADRLDQRGGDGAPAGARSRRRSGTIWPST